MSVPYLRVLLALALILQGCTTTGDTTALRPQTSTDNTDTLQSQAPSARLAAIDKAEPDFKGPQVIFSPGSSEVPRNAAPVLDNIAAKLKADPLVNVVLVGHTEDLGSTEFSVAVATRCAQAVGQALIKRGARPSQVRLQPRGNEKFSAKHCTSNACKKQLRRVDIVMSDY